MKDESDEEDPFFSVVVFFFFFVFIVLARKKRRHERVQSAQKRARFALDSFRSFFGIEMNHAFDFIVFVGD